MSISKFPQGQAGLAAAFAAIANHCGPDPVVLDKLSALEGVVLSYTNRALAGSVSVACPAATALAAFLSGALGTAEGHVPVAGNVFTLTTAQDTSDTAFATAKGSAPAVGDVFIVTGTGATVAYLGTTIAALDAALRPYTTRGYNYNQD